MENIKETETISTNEEKEDNALIDGNQEDNLIKSDSEEFVTKRIKISKDDYKLLKMFAIENDLDADVKIGPETLGKVVHTLLMNIKESKLID